MTEMSVSTWVSDSSVAVLYDIVASGNMTEMSASTWVSNSSVAVLYDIVTSGNIA
jgi:hypothetical protein